MTGSGVWTIATLEPTVPALLTNSADWKFSASHNAGAARSALGAPSARWNTGSPQESGMWLQLELPETTDVVEVQPHVRLRPGSAALFADPDGDRPA